MRSSSRKRVSMRDIAAAAGVSVATVSMALADSPQIGAETKGRVRTLCEALGYRADRLRRSATRGRPHRYSFVVLGKTVDDETLSGFLHSLVSLASEHGVRLEVSALADMTDDSAIAAHLRDHARGRDGLVLSGMVSRAVRQEIKRIGLPTVVLGNVLADHVTGNGHDEAFLPSVSCGDVEMGRAATRWLFERGHERVGFLCGSLPPGLYASRWLDGYRLAHFDSGQPLTARHIVNTGMSSEGIVRAVRTLAGEADAPSAWLLPDTRIAVTAVAALREQGVLTKAGDAVFGGRPEVLSRYGLGDWPLITEDTDGMAAAALQLLDLLQQGDAPQRTHLVMPFLVCNLAGHNLPAPQLDKVNM